MSTLEEDPPHMIDIGPLLRGDVKCIRIPVWGSNGVPHIEVNEVELRVVVEVTDIGGNGRFQFVCSGCGHAHSLDFKWAHCPSCGNPIKRP